MAAPASPAAPSAVKWLSRPLRTNCMDFPYALPPNVLPPVLSAPKFGIVRVPSLVPQGEDRYYYWDGSRFQPVKDGEYHPSDSKRLFAIHGVSANLRGCWVIKGSLYDRQREDYVRMLDISLHSSTPSSQHIPLGNQSQGMGHIQSIDAPLARRNRPNKKQRKRDRERRGRRFADVYRPYETGTTPRRDDGDERGRPRSRSPIRLVRRRSLSRPAFVRTRSRSRSPSLRSRYSPTRSLSPVPRRDRFRSNSRGARGSRSPVRARRCVDPVRRDDPLTLSSGTFSLDEVRPGHLDENTLSSELQAIQLLESPPFNGELLTPFGDNGGMQQDDRGEVDGPPVTKSKPSDKLRLIVKKLGQACEARQQRISTDNQILDLKRLNATFTNAAAVPLLCQGNVDLEQRLTDLRAHSELARKEGDKHIRTAKDVLIELFEEQRLDATELDAMRDDAAQQRIQTLEGELSKAKEEVTILRDAVGVLDSSNVERAAQLATAQDEIQAERKARQQEAAAMRMRMDGLEAVLRCVQDGGEKIRDERTADPEQPTEDKSRLGANAVERLNEAVSGVEEKLVALIADQSELQTYVHSLPSAPSLSSLHEALINRLTPQFDAALRAGLSQHRSENEAYTTAQVEALWGRVEPLVRLVQDFTKWLEGLLQRDQEAEQTTVEQAGMDTVK